MLACPQTFVQIDVFVVKWNQPKPNILQLTNRMMIEALHRVFGENKDGQVVIRGK